MKTNIEKKDYLSLLHSLWLFCRYEKLIHSLNKHLDLKDKASIDRVDTKEKLYLLDKSVYALYFFNFKWAVSLVARPPHL